jgi:dimethylhistidine N-methyltransferase
MARTTGTTIPLLDYKPGVGDFRREILNGLAKPQKTTPPKYFYDEKGSSLFEDICRLDEYYIPRKEVSIMENSMGEICNVIGPGAFLIEYGCGNCSKTRLLLDNLPDMAAYVPIDISKEQLLHVSRQVAADNHGLEVLPVCADYTSYFRLPVPTRVRSRKVVYFPGSSFGNFHPKEGKRFLDQVLQVCGPGGGLLIGLDLKKDPAVLHSAYNDGDRVTADFNLNILQRINRELNGDFKRENFEHYAFYNPRKGRVEMHLVSLADQTAYVDGVAVCLARGESIWTESSYKFTLSQVEALAGRSGFKLERYWTDFQQWFAVLYLVAAS